MNRDQFFEKFELLSETPNAVGKMRELILDLAVRGKLVSQNFSDEPVSKLVDRIIKRKNSLGTPVDTSEKSIVQDTAHRLDIPENWVMVGAINPARIISENGKKVQTRDILEVGEYPVVDQGKVFIRGYTNDPEKVIKVQNPLIVFGDHTREIKLIEFDFVIGADGVKVLEPVEIDAHYYYLALRWLPLESRGYGRHFKLLRESSIPLPPLAEQKRIVAKVDELMALCDRLEAQQKQREAQQAALVQASLTRFTDAPTPTNLEFLFHKSYAVDPAELRKTILTLAVNGGLVPFDASNVGKVADHISFLNGYAFKSEWFKSSGTRLCRNVNVAHGTLDWRDTAHVEQKIADEFLRFSLSTGDIVLSLDRPIISTGLKIAKIQPTDLPCLLLQRVAKPIPHNPDLDLGYLYLWFNSPAFIDAIDPGRSNGVPHISTKEVLGLPFVLPPLAEQKRIVAKVEELMGVVERLEGQLAASREVGAKLIEAVVAEIAAAA